MTDFETFDSEDNFILKTDSYKHSHWRQYPPGITHAHTYFESRGGEYKETMFFGAQYILKKHFAGPVVNKYRIEEAKDVIGSHFGDTTIFNEAGWKRILNVHGGHIPLMIRNIPEGTVMPTRNVLMTVDGTDAQLPWLNSHVETLLSQVWYPSTVGVGCRTRRGIVLQYLEETGDPSLIDYKVHDFGFRASTSVESAGIGGLAHLTQFSGTDTLQAIMVGRKYYHERMAGSSIPASEHGTMTSWRRRNEYQAFKHMLEEFPTGFVAVVSDSYDIFHACKELWGRRLRDQVLERNGVLVVRPDSGHPPTVVVKVLEILGEAFGFTVNTKGYRVLHPKIRVIQGDGIDTAMLREILETMKKAGWSADNVSFGSGGGLLQKVNRDTQKFAFKCTAVKVNGIWRTVYKDPVTDPGKRSKKGRQVLTKQKGVYKTMRLEEAERRNLPNELGVTFLNGAMGEECTLKEVRARSRAA